MILMLLMGDGGARFNYTTSKRDLPGEIKGERGLEGRAPASPRGEGERGLAKE